MQRDRQISRLDGNSISDNVMPYLFNDGITPEEILSGEYPIDMNESDMSECGNNSTNVGSFEETFDRCLRETAVKLCNKHILGLHRCVSTIIVPAWT